MHESSSALHLYLFLQSAAGRDLSRWREKPTNMGMGYWWRRVWGTRAGRTRSGEQELGEQMLAEQELGNQELRE